MVFTRVGVLFCLEVGLLTESAQVLPLRHDLSESPSGGAEAAAFTPDGKLLVSVRDRGRLRLWDTATGKILTRIDSYGEPKGCYTKHRGMAFSPDGKTLAIGVRAGITATGHIILFDVVDGESLERKTTLAGHTAGVTAVTYTPDGTTLISASLDKEIRLWDVATGKTRQILRGHTERILGMALSPDGKVLVSGDPGEVKVWDPETGQETGAWKVVDLVGLAISPDGKIAAVDSFPRWPHPIGQSTGRSPAAAGGRVTDGVQPGRQAVRFGQPGPQAAADGDGDRTGRESHPGPLQPPQRHHARCRVQPGRQRLGVSEQRHAREPALVRLRWTPMTGQVLGSTSNACWR